MQQLLRSERLPGSSGSDAPVLPFSGQDVLSSERRRAVRLGKRPVGSTSGICLFFPLVLYVVVFYSWLIPVRCC